MYHVIRQVGSVISFSRLEEEHNCSISSKVNLNSPGGERQPRCQEKQASLDQKRGLLPLIPTLLSLLQSDHPLQVHD